MRVGDANNSGFPEDFTHWRKRVVGAEMYIVIIQNPRSLEGVEPIPGSRTVIHKEFDGGILLAMH